MRTFRPGHPGANADCHGTRTDENRSYLDPQSFIIGFMLRLTAIPLTALPAQLPATITAIESADAALAQRLLELGFLPGERIRVVAQGPIARDPLAVRVGDSTFALRRIEAACIRVEADTEAALP